MFILTSLMMLVALAFDCMAAMLFWRELRFGRRALDGASLLLAFLFVQSMHVMLAGLGGFLSGFWMSATSLLGVIAIAGFRPLRVRVCECCKLFVAPCVRELRAAARANPVVTACAAVAAAYVAFHVLLFVCIAPPLTFDALTYHLSKVAQWVHSGSLSLPNLPVKRVFWPSGMELLNCWWAVFRHDDFLIEMPGLFFHALAVVLTYDLARNMGLGRKPSAYSAIAFSVAPAIVGHGSTCLTDLPTAAMFYLLLALWTSPMDEESDAIRRWLVSAIVIFLAIGIKPTIAFMLPGVFVAAIPFARRRDFAVLRSLFRAERMLWILVFASLFLGSFWYLRNAIRFGNPLYPVVAGKFTGDGIQSGAFSFANLRMALDMLVRQGGFLDGAWVVPNLFRMTGWGWFAVACGLPASLFLAFKSKRFAFFFAGQILALCVVLGSVLADSSCLRFLIWLPGPLAIGFFGEAATSGFPRPIVGVLYLVAVLTSALNLVTGLANATRIDFINMARNSGLRPGLNGAFQMHIASNVPDGEDLAVFMGREGPLYLAYGPRFSHGVFTIDASDTEIDFARLLDDAGVHYLFFPYWRQECPTASAALGRQIEAGLMQKLGFGIFARNASAGEEAEGKGEME